MQSLKVLIVEDEILVAKTIQMYLEERCHSVSDIVISYEEAIDTIGKNAPDIILLDIKLYGTKSGIELAKTLNSYATSIPFIFLTSQLDERILDNAMLAKPHGYLVKPIQKETLWTTIELAFKKVSAEQENSKIKIVEGSKIYLLSMQEILYIKVDHVYILIFLVTDEVLHLRMALKDIINLLDENIFVQCHRSYIINIEHITYFDGNILTISNSHIPVSRTYKNELKVKLKF